MLNKAKEKLTQHKNLTTHYHKTTITQPLNHNNADLTICSLTLQFLNDTQRRDTLKYARAAAKRKSAIIITEKIYQTNPFWQDIATDLTQERKEKAGLTAKEIRDKQASIRGVLIPHTTDELIAELKQTGWGTIDEIFRWHNWIMLAAQAQ